MTADGCAGRVALVTGASRGIGAALARRLASEGATVAVTARTVKPGEHIPGSLRETVDLIEDDGGRALPVGGDLSKPADRERVVATVERELGPIDILVNNAAVTFFSPIRELTEKHFRLMFAVQVEAPIHLVQLVVPAMRARHEGWIVNISSVGARHIPGPPYEDFFKTWGGTVYGMCKAALERLTTGLAAELADDGIAVNALAPNGIVPTFGSTLHNQEHLEERQDLLEPIEWMAEAALALSTCKPDEITGRIAYSEPLMAELGLTPFVAQDGVPAEITTAEVE